MKKSALPFKKKYFLKMDNCKTLIIINSLNQFAITKYLVMISINILFFIPLSMKMKRNSFNLIPKMVFFVLSISSFIMSLSITCEILGFEIEPMCDLENVYVLVPLIMIIIISYKICHKITKVKYE